MSNEFYTLYYIDEPGGKTGPHDAMAMVRKIRNGKLTPQMIVYVGDAYNGVPAGELPEFEVFFNPPGHESAAPVTVEGPLNIQEMLRDAWAYFSDNQLLSLAAGAMIVALIIIGLVLSAILPIVLTAAICSLIGGALLFLFFIYIERATGGHPIDEAFARDLLKQRGIDLGVAAAAIAAPAFGIPAMIMAFLPQFGLLLLVLGTLGFALFIFTPLFMLHDPSLSFQQAMTMSRQWIMGQSPSNIVVILTLVGINAIATMLLLLPVFVTLPVTFIALADLFTQRIRPAI